tara:strand:- start:864 stop:1157 length:294 start_codon:yes stop_codon:yes gene_type:complete
MTQYDEKVELQKQILKAEEYKDTPKNLHAHSLDSMWYETEETKPQTKEGVVDVQYMDGRIERTLKNGKKITLVEGMKGEDLVQEVTRNLADSGKELE